MSLKNPSNFSLNLLFSSILGPKKQLHMYLNAINKKRYMKRLFFPLLMLVILATACKKEEDKDYASLILGSWINTQIDNQALLTDASFVMEFRTDKVEFYASGYQLDSDNKTWLESENFTYSVNGKTISIGGTDNLNKVFNIIFEIQSVDDKTLSYSVTKFMIDNVDYPDSKIYTCTRPLTDLSSQFVGTWYGKNSTAGTTDDKYHYWEYFADGSFNYYFQDDSGNWINKPDNEGKYFLYGGLMATNYTNDLLSGSTGKAYECWNISIAGNTMDWTAIRENGKTVSFQMEKVSGPPQ